MKAERNYGKFELLRRRTLNANELICRKVRVIIRPPSLGSNGKERRFSFSTALNVRKPKSESCR